MCALCPIGNCTFFNVLKRSLTRKVVWSFTDHLQCQNLISVLLYGCSLARNRSTLRIEDIKKRALRFVPDDCGSSYQDLLIQCEVSGIKIMTLRLLVIEVFKCVNKLDPEYLNEIFTQKMPTTFVILLMWRDLNRILQSSGLNPLEITRQKYGICYQTIVKKLYHWMI